MASFISNHRKPYAALSDFVAAKPLTGKTVVVTGAGRGVGEHIAREFAAAGAARIGIVGRDKARIESAKKTLTSAYPEADIESFAADITNESEIARVFKSFGTPDILVNNAGQFPDDGPFVEQDLKPWWTSFAVNVLGTATVTQQYLRALGPPTSSSTKKRGTVLNVSSMAAHMRFPLIAWSGYNSSKLAAARLFEYLRFEHPDVKFLNIHPGQIASDGFDRSKASPPPDGMTDGTLAAQFHVWAATDVTDGLSGRFLWAEWDIDELTAKKAEILDKDLLLVTFDGFDHGF
jgi:NAD(P)-dependent dehydrogenase (short-subunit alcohol dehydrogenase family)